MTDLLVIGSGGAGLSAALEAARSGAKVCVVTKSLPTQAQTCMAQGGINAALGNLEPDSVEEHVADTLRSAHGLADEAMIRRCCEAGPETIEWLDRLLTPFSRLEGAKTPLQSIAQRRLGGASHPRACYAQDYTGLKILQTLYDRCLEAGVEFRTRHYLLDLLVRNETVSGAIFWDQDAGEVVALHARSTLLATGGFGALYHGYSTNAAGATGDGMAALLRAGGVLRNMEFVQFHPTALEGSAILISEGARGAGATLIDQAGERFTDELGPRDEVARAIFAKIRQGERVYLDLRHLGEKRLNELMPQELHLARLHAGIDPLKEPLPIAPAAHYSMGGIAVDRDLSALGLRGLWAAGECAEAGIHGANRLGGNSLLEIVAFGRIAAKNALNSPVNPAEHTEELESAKRRIDALLQRKGKLSPHSKRKILGKRLYHDLGIVRDRELMEDALSYLGDLQSRLPQVAPQDPSRRHNQALIELLEYENSLLLARALCESALHRRESRGAHWRSDFPQEDPEFAQPTLYSLENGTQKSEE